AAESWLLWTAVLLAAEVLLETGSVLLKRWRGTPLPVTGLGQGFGVAHPGQKANAASFSPPQCGHVQGFALSALISSRTSV
ncbi:hypothetical protein ABTY59_33945, partial [Streptomyces sp. NPDC096079]|uniref:hypothetical protein n=1 Tax=Streptomyces sp. NPDC096079 TaxID=3155820 RepID=UPI0033307481